MEEMHTVSFYDLAAKIEEINTSCKYVLSLGYVDVDYHGYKKINRCNSEECQHYSYYDHTELRAIYYNHAGELIQIDDSFIVESYSRSKEASLRKRVNVINRSKNDKQFTMSHRNDPNWSYAMVKTKVMHNLDKCKTLDGLAEFISRCCRSYDDQKPEITSVDDIITPSSIRIHVEKCKDNKSKGKTFDYADVTVPMIAYGYSKDEIMDLVKKFKPDIDKKVCTKLKKLWIGMGFLLALLRYQI